MTRIMLQPRKQSLRDWLAISADGLIAKSARILELEDSLPRPGQIVMMPVCSCQFPWWAIAIAFLIGITFGGSVVYGLVGV
ncbi:MAG: hypothetical protein A3E01_04590 [Gammaproteobacteria bacterium RIFCSPHIGHO2_12_FULL_63_22]|nr:MAG: hypothetical protein A3E01_04590 [Gammaproteobacteria bacterium RIFCSPHIGHO2_12_FULL_63_22]